MRNAITELPARVDVPRAAEILGGKTSLVYRLAAKGELPHYRIGRRITFAETDLAAFVIASRQPGRLPHTA